MGRVRRFRPDFRDLRHYGSTHTVACPRVRLAAVHMFAISLQGRTAVADIGTAS